MPRRRLLLWVPVIVAGGFASLVVILVAVAAFGLAIGAEPGSSATPVASAAATGPRATPSPSLPAAATPTVQAPTVAPTPSPEASVAVAPVPAVTPSPATPSTPTPSAAPTSVVPNGTGGGAGALAAAAYVPVLGVADGDTISVRLNGVRERIRIIGLDAPELNPRQCFGQEAASRMQSLAQGQQVRLVVDPSQADRDRYGRLLRHVVLTNGKVAAGIMVAEGYAREYTYDRPHIPEEFPCG